MVTYLSNSTMKTDHGCSVEIYSGTNAFADCDHRTISLQATLYHVVIDQNIALLQMHLVPIYQEFPEMFQEGFKQ